MHTDTSPQLDDDTLAFARRVFQAVRGGDVQHIGELLDMGLPANLRNEKGDSLLMLASYHGHDAMVARLLDRGGDPELANDRGQTPLGAAAFKGDGAVVRRLLEAGASVDGRGEGGRTALMIAAMFDRIEIIELLLDGGADREARDGSGMTALTAAETMGAGRAAAVLMWRTPEPRWNDDRASTSERDIHLRALAPGEAEVVARVWFDSWQATGLADGSDASSLTRFTQRMTGEGWQVIVADVGSEIVGFVAFEPESRWLRQIFVKPGWQRSGIGTQLLGAAKHAMSKGFWLRTQPENRPAMAFYERLGLRFGGEELHPTTGQRVTRFIWSGEKHPN